MNKTEELLLERYLEHEMNRMEKRRLELEDEIYVVTKALDTQLVKREWACQ